MADDEHRLRELQAAKASAIAEVIREVKLTAVAMGFKDSSGGDFDGRPNWTKEDWKAHNGGLLQVLEHFRTCADPTIMEAIDKDMSMKYGWAHVTVPKYDAVCAERDRLQAIVDKLMTTADAVPVIPGIDRVWFPGDLESRWIDADYLCGIGTSTTPMAVEHCYSTKEAAEAEIESNATTTESHSQA